MSDEAVVEATNLHRSYDDTVALDGVSCSIRSGEVFGLIGPNGAGKTTLVRALTGTTNADGEVRTFGVAPAEADRARIGLLPQEFAPPERLTAHELLEYYGGLYDEARDPDSLLADVGLAAAADTWYEDLSGGQKRRACVGIALVNEPDLLFLDEPTTGIDPAGRRALWDLLDGLAAGGTTVVLTSHSMEEVERLADRVGLLRDGQLVAVGSPSELVAEHGGPSRLVVGTAEATATRGGGDGTTATDTGAEALREAGFEVEASAAELVVEGVTPADLGRAVAALEEAGVTYDSLTWTEPSLEDVYLRLTGERFEGAFTPGASVVDGSEGGRDDDVGGDHGGTRAASRSGTEVGE